MADADQLRRPGRRREPHLRERPECIRLGVRAGVEPSDRPPVRIFIGTEPAQFRPERVLVWSIEQLRDPARVYEIHLLKNLAGYDKRGWTTGFTNLRFAIPHYCGHRGRAIYNDEDQIYLRDPAELFDLELGDHGFLAISDRESSVMLIECERMAEVWTLEGAQRGRKRALLRRAAPLRGALDPGWNARDGEYLEGGSSLLHYTTLHTQPWRPFPERFVYREGNQAHLWHELERSAIAAGFDVFARERPSEALTDWLADAGASDVPTSEVRSQRERQLAAEIHELLEQAGAGSLLELVPERAEPAESRTARWGMACESECGVASLLDANEPVELHDAVVCIEGLEALPSADVPWIVDELFRRAQRLVCVAVRVPSRQPKRGFRQPPVGTVHTIDWWERQFEAAAARRPEVRWELMVCRHAGKGGDDGFEAAGLEHRQGGPPLAGVLPRVWMLTDDRPGNTTQAFALAEELDWPTARIALEFDARAALPNALLGARLCGRPRSGQPALRAPWPDLVIAAGRRSAPVARWIRQQARGRTRIVQLGRRGSNPARAFDLAVSTLDERLPPQPNRIETLAPLPRLRGALEDAMVGVGSLFDQAPAPRVAFFVGGPTDTVAFSARDARALAGEVNIALRESGGSLFVATSRRTPRAAVDVLRRELDVTHFHRWSGDERADRRAALGYLALADCFLVTGDSGATIAEACATGKPVTLAPMRARRRGPVDRLIDGLAALITACAALKPQNDRGTQRPQAGLTLLCARLVDGGWVRPTCDLKRIHRELYEHGWVRVLADGFDAGRGTPHDERERVAERVRKLMGIPKT